MRSIIVIRLGAVGDVVLTLGVLTSLRASYPAAKLTLVTRPVLEPLVAQHPSISDIMITPPEESAIALALRIRGRRPNIVVDLHGKARAFVLWLLSGASRHIVWRGRPTETRMRHLLGGARARPAGLQTEASFLAAERAVGHPLRRFAPTLVVGATDEALALRLWRELVAQKSAHAVVVLSPGAQWATKRWPVAHYVALARILISAGLSVVVVGSETEVVLASAICAQVPQVVVLAGQLGLAPLASFLQKARLMICGDTGPLHIARAVGCRTVGLFGSTSPDAFTTGDDVFLSEALECAPCTFHGRASCPLGTLRCLEELSPERVARAALALIAQSATDTSSPAL